jgi:hypothetical protein
MTDILFDGNINVGNGNLGITSAEQIATDIDLWTQFPDKPHKYIIEPIGIDRVITLPKIGILEFEALKGHSLSIRNNSSSLDIIIHEASINSVIYILFPLEEVWLVAEEIGTDSISADVWNRTGPVGLNYIRPPPSSLDRSIMIWDGTNASFANESLITIDNAGNIIMPSGTNITIGGSPIGGPTNAVTQVNTGTGLTGGPITSTGTISIANTGVTSGTYHSPLINVNNQGQITSAQNILTTLGDLLVYSGTTSVRLPRGTDNYVLISDSTSSTGLKWVKLTDILAGMGTIDTFGRLRISENRTLFTSQYTQNKSPEKYNEIISNASGSASSVFNSTTASVSMNVGKNDFIIRKTRRNMVYYPGKSQQILVSGIMSIQTNVTKRMGYYSSNFTSPYAPRNGLYFETSGGNIFACIVNNGSITAIQQSNWNNDKLDGTGTSGIVLDPTKTQSFYIAFSWISGQVDFGFYFGNQLIIAHSYVHTNAATFNFMATPNLPITTEIRGANINGTSGSLVHICSSVSTEGGDDSLLDPFSSGRFINNNADGELNNPSTSRINALISIKIKNNVEGAVAFIKSFSSVVDGDHEIGIFVYLNPVFNNPISFTSTDTNSIVEFNNSTQNNTWIVSAERILYRTYSGRSNQISSNLLDTPLPLTMGINGVGDVISIGVTTENTSDVYGSFNWVEV